VCVCERCVCALARVPHHGWATVLQAWREYYQHRFITELERWESSSHQLQLWDGNYNPSAATHARDVVAAPPLRLHRPAPAPDAGESPTTACHHRHRDHQPSSDVEASDLGSPDLDEPSSSEDDDGTEEEGEERGSRSESEAGAARERERESESESEEQDEERRRKVVKAQVMLARRKRRMISRSTPASTATSPRRKSQGTSRCLLRARCWGVCADGHDLASRRAVSGAPAAFTVHSLLSASLPPGKAERFLHHAHAHTHTRTRTRTRTQTNG
jgi:hypothetical protein